MSFEYTPDHIKKLLINKPWTKAKQRFDAMDTYDPKVIETLDIDEKEWLQFCIDHYDLAEHHWEVSKPHYSGDSKALVDVNVSLGRNKFNSYELNWGKIGDSNKILIDMIGKNNFDKLNFHPKYILVRLLIKLPGQGVPWHVDDAGSFLKLFPDLKITNFPKTQQGRIVRYWFPVTDWQDGHMFQISKTILWKYKKGQVFDIPIGQGHASANAGLTPQYSVSLTGIIDD